MKGIAIILGAVMMLCGLLQFATHSFAMENPVCGSVILTAYIGERSGREFTSALSVAFLFIYFLSESLGAKKVAVRWRDGVMLSFVAARTLFFLPITDFILYFLRRGIFNSRIFEHAGGRRSEAFSFIT